MASTELAAVARTRTRERILDAFAEGARVDGPRNVVMAELARDLGISTRTLYQHFPSKADLVDSLMERWAAEVQRTQNANIAQDATPFEHMLKAAESWLEANAASRRRSGFSSIAIFRTWPGASRTACARSCGRGARSSWSSSATTSTPGSPSR